jgi:hypothetical protein
MKSFYISQRALKIWSESLRGEHLKIQKCAVNFLKYFIALMSPALGINDVSGNWYVFPHDVFLLSDYRICFSCSRQHSLSCFFICKRCYK